MAGKRGFPLHMLFSSVVLAATCRVYGQTPAGPGKPPSPSYSRGALPYPPIFDFLPGTPDSQMVASFPNFPGAGQLKDGYVIDSAKLPFLTGQSLSAVVINLTPCGQNSPHWHPRGTEILYVISGKLILGFVDTNETLWYSILTQGMTSVIPQGLLHFQQEIANQPAATVGIFNSEATGAVRGVNDLFKLPPGVLATSLKTSPDQVASLNGTKPGNFPVAAPNVCSSFTAEYNSAAPATYHYRRVKKF